MWTGIEYQVAGHCIYEGLVAEGLRIVEGVRSRHDGVRRNPWDEFECGHHYARAMASWSVMLALTGCRWSAVEGTLSFAPREEAMRDGEFQSFFSCGSAWGTVEVGTDGARIEVWEGRLTARSVEVTLPDGRRHRYAPEEGVTVEPGESRALQPAPRPAL